MPILSILFQCKRSEVRVVELSRIYWKKKFHRCCHWSETYYIAIKYLRDYVYLCFETVDDFNCNRRFAPFGFTSEASYTKKKSSLNLEFISTCSFSHTIWYCNAVARVTKFKCVLPGAMGYCDAVACKQIDLFGFLHCCVTFWHCCLRFLTAFIQKWVKQKSFLISTKIFYWDMFFFASYQFFYKLYTFITIYDWLITFPLDYIHRLIAVIAKRICWWRFYKYENKLIFIALQTIHQIEIIIFDLKFE